MRCLTTSSIIYHNQSYFSSVMQWRILFIHILFSVYKIDLFNIVINQNKESHGKTINKWIKYEFVGYWFFLLPQIFIWLDSVPVSCFVYTYLLPIANEHEISKINEYYFSILRFFRYYLITELLSVQNQKNLSMLFYQ